MQFNKTVEEAQQLWVEALQSGRYEQATGVLQDDSSQFCCLGVACDLFAKYEPQLGLSWKPVYYAPGDDDHHAFASFQGGIQSSTDDATGVPPAEVMLWLGLGTNNGAWDPEQPQSMLTSRNDDGADFEEIANIILERPGKLLANKPNLYRIRHRPGASTVESSAYVVADSLEAAREMTLLLRLLPSSITGVELVEKREVKPKEVA